MLQSDLLTQYKITSTRFYIQQQIESRFFIHGNAALDPGTLLIHIIAVISRV